MPTSQDHLRLGGGITAGTGLPAEWDYDHYSFFLPPLPSPTFSVMDRHSQALIPSRLAANDGHIQEEEPERREVAVPADPHFDHSFVTMSTEAISVVIEERASDNMLDAREQSLNGDAYARDRQNIPRDTVHIFQCVAVFLEKLGLTFHHLNELSKSGATGEMLPK
ncbi:hypothetical protein C8R46DRAFT_1210737 [Mycena filopes]|nr:hypothetical protein C8R46DRAFT_1210737 [Mycena filopes]